MKRKLKVESVPFKDTIHDWLRASPANGAWYLQSALASGNVDEFLLAFRDIAEAVGIADLAKRSGFSRAGVYKMLSDKGQPGFANIFKMLQKLRLTFHVGVLPEKKASRGRKPAQRKAG